MNKTFNAMDRAIVSLLRKEGLIALRYILAIIFIWFGILKPLGYSPASELVANTVYWFNPSWFVPFLGWWEVAIGLCFLYKPAIRMGLMLMAFQMVGTFLPLILLPEVVYGPKLFTFTLEGQYIIKNLIIIAAGMVVGSHVRDKPDSNY